MADRALRNGDTCSEHPSSSVRPRPVDVPPCAASWPMGAGHDGLVVGQAMVRTAGLEGEAMGEVLEAVGDDGGAPERLPAYLSRLESDVSARAELRYERFLQAELEGEEIPWWHPLRHEYQTQLRSLQRRRRRRGPRRVLPSSDA